MVHVLVIGAYGSAGVAAAGDLAEDPAIDRLTMVDDGDPGGGLCILRGCMPSKEVLSAAAHRFQVQHDHRIDGDPAVDVESVIETKDEHISNFAAHRRGAVERLAQETGVEFVEGTARFVDERVIEAGGRRLEPDYVVVASGSSISSPDIPGIERVSTMDSADVLDATSLPDTGVVMGFGVVGLELVPYLSEAGDVDLTVIEHDDRPLDDADDVFGDAMLDLYRDAFGVEIRTNTDEQSVEPAGDGGVSLTVEREGEPETIEGGQLFTFTGRRPNLDPLDLEQVGLDPSRGWVRETLQATGDDRVFVVGDANGREPVLHVAKEEGFLAAANIRRHLDGEPLREYTNTYHRVVFSGAGVYPFARVGHSATSASEAGLDHEVITREASRDGVFKTKAAPEGLARFVVDAEDGTVLGYQGLHLHADVMAKTMQVVIENELPVDAVPNRAYHPTTPEILDGLLREASEVVG